MKDRVAFPLGRRHEFGLLRALQARHGSSFLVTSRDEVLAEIHPPSKSLQPRRQPGALREKIRIAADFDTLPPEVLAAG